MIQFNTGTRILLSIFIVLTVWEINAQNPTWQWAKGVGGENGEYVTSSCTDYNGNLYLTGYFLSDSIKFGTTTLKNNSRQSLFVVKYDSTGNVLWAKKGGGPNNAYIVSDAIASDQSGNIYLTGSFSGTLVLGNSTMSTITGDVFVAKFDSFGNNIWAINNGVLNGYASGNGISIDRNKNVYVAGAFTSATISFGSTTLTNPQAGTGELFITKYDSLGKVIWAKSAGGNYNEDVQDLSTDNIGNTYITGNFTSPTITFGSTNLNNSVSDSSTADIFIAKYDFNGNFVWAKSAGGTSYDWSRGIKADNKNNVYVVGTFTDDSLTIGTVSIAGKKNGPNASFIFNLNSNGSVTWAKSIVSGGNYNTGAHDVDYDKKGNVYVGGYYVRSLVADSVKLTSPIPNQGGGLYVVKYNHTGKAVCAKSAAEPYFDILRTLSTDTYGNVYVAGFYKGDSIKFDNTVLKNSSMPVSTLHDLFVAKLTDSCPLSSTSVRSILNDMTVSYYPNPVRDEILIDLAYPQQSVELSIFDASGRLINSHAYNNSKSIKLNLSSLHSGFYLIRIISKENSTSFRIIKE